MAELADSFAKLAKGLDETVPALPELPQVEDYIGGETDLVLRWNIVAETTSGEVISQRKGMQCVPDLLDPDHLAQAGRTLGTVLNLQLSSPLLRHLETEIRRRIQRSVEMPALPVRPRPTTTLSAEVLPPSKSEDSVPATEKDPANL